MLKKLTAGLFLIIINCSPIYAQDNTAPDTVASPEIQEISIRKKKNESNELSGAVSINKSYHARKYTLGPNDVIGVYVLGSPELTQSSIRVQPDGRINITYLEGMNVTGKTVDELQEKIKKTYSEYLINPQVSITLEQSRPFIVYLAGGIYNPGSYELNTITNSTPFYSKPEAFIERKTPLLSNVIVAAGGVTYDADIEHVQIKNDIDGSSFELNLYDIIEKASSDQDIYLMAGDKVYIPKLPTPFAIDKNKYRLLIKSTFFQREVPVKVVGDVNKPGLIKLNSSDSCNINSAVAAAGGFASGSPYIPSKIFISRADNNNKLITHVINPRKEDVMLMPNDIVYVPEKVRPVIGKGFDYIFRILAPMSAFSDIYDTWDIINNR